MRVKRGLPDAGAHISIFVRGRTRRDFIAFHTDPVLLTPARMKLLAKLVEPDQWRRSTPSETDHLGRGSSHGREVARGSN
jgi:hypothetical protein